MNHSGLFKIIIYAYLIGTRTATPLDLHQYILILPQDDEDSKQVILTEPSVLRVTRKTVSRCKIRIGEQCLICRRCNIRPSHNTRYIKRFQFIGPFVGTVAENAHDVKNDRLTVELSTDPTTNR